MAEHPISHETYSMMKSHYIALAVLNMRNYRGSHKRSFRSHRLGPNFITCEARPRTVMMNVRLYPIDRRVPHTFITEGLAKNYRRTGVQARKL